MKCRSLVQRLVLLSVLTVSSACTAGVQHWAGESSAVLPSRILFVGNSFTYYNNGLQRHLYQLLRAGEVVPSDQLRLRILTLSGGRLPEHRPAFAEIVASEPWDVVVLQGHSRGPISPPTAAPFRDAVREFDAIVRHHGARTAMFMTWAYEGRPEMTAQLSEAYSAIGDEVGALVAPVGLAFARAAQLMPEVALRTADGRHPSMAGTYLAACVFYATLMRRSPRGLAYDAGLNLGVVAELQRVAWEITSEYATRYTGGDRAW